MSAQAITNAAGGSPRSEAIGEGRPAAFGIPSPRFEAAAAAYTALQLEELKAWSAYLRLSGRNGGADALKQWVETADALHVARQRFQRIARESQGMAEGGR